MYISFCQRNIGAANKLLTMTQH